MDLSFQDHFTGYWLYKINFSESGLSPSKVFLGDNPDSEQENKKNPKKPSDLDLEQMSLILTLDLDMIEQTHMQTHTVTLT